jgi:KDO2-lipid IV(A) lauroyltransferase
MKALNFLLYGFLWIIAHLPTRALYWISDILFVIVYHLFGYRKNVVYGNLRNAFPEKTEQERQVIAKKFYRHLCDFVVEVLAIIKFSPGDIKKRCVYKNPEILHEYAKAGKSLAIVTGHYGNWEWTNGFNLWAPGYVSYAIYLPLKDKFFDKLVRKQREKFGSKMIAKRDSVRELLKSHQKGIMSATLYLGDQTPMRSEIHYWTRFLNQETPIFLGVEKIARKTGDAVFFTYTRKLKRGYYELELVPICDDARQTEPYEITEKHTRLLEKAIQEKPEYWLWSHRRWKHKKEVS